jgi:hypothetical protein
MFWLFLSLSLNVEADPISLKKKQLTPCPSGEKGGPHGYRNSHLVARESSTGILGILAKNLAIILDKGRDVEYRAPVLIAQSHTGL